MKGLETSVFEKLKTSVQKGLFRFEFLILG